MMFQKPMGQQSTFGPGLGKMPSTNLVISNMKEPTQARCRFTNPDDLFVRGAAQRRAATICRPCPVATECLADALDNRMEFGVWGGMTDRQRRALLRQHPEVNSWSEF